MTPAAADAAGEAVAVLSPSAVALAALDEGADDSGIEEREVGLLNQAVDYVHSKLRAGIAPGADDQAILDIDRGVQPDWGGGGADQPPPKA